MVLALDRETGVDQFAAHLGAQVGVVVGRRHREVATLVAHLVAAVAALLGATGVPDARLGVDVVVARVLVGLEPDVVEDVELGLGAEVDRVGDAAARQVGLGLLRDVARVAAVGLAGQRVVDEESQVQRLLGAERVKDGRRGVGQQQHVRFVDGLEPADRRTVEAEAVGEDLLVEGFNGHGEVLHDAGQIAEAHVDGLDVVFPDVPQNLVGAGEHESPPWGGWTVTQARGMRFPVRVSYVSRA